jgi:lipopolysaccharide cholinephosphotransferase
MKEITETKELQSIVLGLLDKIDVFCSSHGIRYSLAGGTLIGAVRHRGFIPWDDDADVMMPRPDYERFCREFSAPESSVHTFGNDPDYFYPYAKVFDDRTILVEDRDPKGRSAVSVDVFPIDGFQDGIRDPKRKLRRQHLCYAVLSWRRAPPLFRRRSFAKQVAAWASLPVRLVPLRCRKRLAKAALRNLTSFASEQPFEASPFVGDCVWGYGLKEVFSRSVFSDWTTLEFEGRNFRAIGGWRDFVSAIYGDISELPPPKQQITHHSFRAWWKS